jgi:thiol-disulfide isomerase/thioredoxin
MISRIYFGLAAFALISAIGAGWLGAQEREQSPLVGKPAPDFSLATLDGGEVKLSSQNGNVVVLDFWATWCPPCREAMPHLQKLSADKRLAEKGLRIYAVNLREKPQAVQKFMDANNYTFTVPMDATGAVAQQYQVKAIPTTVIVGRDGKVTTVFIGLPGDEALDAAINAALDARK